jgi:hypothetical protein
MEPVRDGGDGMCDGVERAREAAPDHARARIALGLLLDTPGSIGLACPVALDIECDDGEIFLHSFLSSGLLESDSRLALSQLSNRLFDRFSYSSQVYTLDANPSKS